MSKEGEVLRLVNCGLDEVIDALLRATPIDRTAAEREPFKLPSPDSFNVFAFYAGRRDLWPRKRAVQAREIDELLQSLDIAPASPPRHARGRRHDLPVWTLTRLEAHRFGGLHRHCGPTGQDPDPFILEFDKEVTLIGGFNGAGKTALLSAIIWCITGKALRSQHMPDEVHEPMPVEWTGDGHAEEDVTDASPREIAIPPVVPIPSGEELELLSDQPRLDTWVRLTLVKRETGEVHNVTRKLVARPGRRITVAVEGLGELGLSQTALEVGTLMPGVAASMRFDEKTDFAHAIAQLTGLKPLEDLGSRIRRVIRRLEQEETRSAERARDDKLQLFETRRQRLVEGWDAQTDLGKVPEILLPGQKNEEQDCTSSINAIRDGLRQKQGDLTIALEIIFGRRQEFGGKPDVERMVQAVDLAMDQLKRPALASLPSIATITLLGKISEEDVAAADAVLSDLLRRAAAMTARQEDQKQAARWQLYSRVAIWHSEHHPDLDMIHCPVCSADLADVPPDALVDLSVKEALERCRAADADMAKTVTEWARDEAATLAESLPETVKNFIDERLPGGLEDLFRKGFVDELLNQEEFGGRLAALRQNGKALWEESCLETPLPARPASEDNDLPAILRGGKLAARITNVRHALALAKHRNISKVILETRVKKYIGSAAAVDSEHVQTRQPKTAPDKAPLRNQLEMIRQGARNAAPIVSLIRQLDDLDAARREWEVQDRRLQLIARAIPAVTAVSGISGTRSRTGNRAHTDP